MTTNTSFQNRTGHCGGVAIRGAAWIMIAMAGLFLQPVAAVAGTQWWDGSSDTSWNVPANWSIVIGGGTDPGAVPGSSDDVIFNSSATIATNLVTLGGNQAARSLMFNANATGTISLANNTLTLGTGGIVVDAASGDHTISSGIAVGANNQTWNIGANRTLTASGVISGSATITKTGTGTLWLNRKSQNGFFEIFVNGTAFQGGLITESLGQTCERT